MDSLTSTIFKPIFQVKLQKYISLFLALMPFIFLLIAIGMKGTGIVARLMEEISAKPEIIQTLIVFYLMIFIMYLIFNSLEKTTIVIDFKGVHKKTTGLATFGNFSIPWADITSIDASKIQKQVKIKSKNKLLPVMISLPFWSNDQYLADENFSKPPKTIFSIKKYDVDKSALLFEINKHLADDNKIKLTTNSLILKDHTDLGFKVKAITMFSLWMILCSILVINVLAEIILNNDYFWMAWSAFASVGFFMSMLILKDELISNNVSKLIGSLLASILFGCGASSIVASSIILYTKYNGQLDSIKLELINRDKTSMSWNAVNYEWNEFKIIYEKGFERGIEIGQQITVNTKKGPLNIYLATFSEFNAAIGKYNKEDNNENKIENEK